MTVVRPARPFLSVSILVTSTTLRHTRRTRRTHTPHTVGREKKRERERERKRKEKGRTLDELDAVVRGGGGADVENAHVLLAAVEQLVDDPLAEESTATNHSVLL
jgi:cytochrome c556